MNQSLGGFRAALLAGWTALSAAGWLYARSKGIPAWVAVPVLAAFLVEYPFYLVPAFAEVRQRFARHLPWFLVLSFVAPYVIYASNTGQFHWWALAQLAALATALSLWYKILPAAPLADGAFLVLVAAVVMRGYFDPIYTSPFSGLHVEILGHVALTRLCAMVMLVERRVPGVGYGFMPSLAEWKIGLRHFVCRRSFSFAVCCNSGSANGRAAPRWHWPPRPSCSARCTWDFAHSPTGNSRSPRRWPAGSTAGPIGRPRVSAPAW
jgi:hypothetical protein